MDEFMKELEEGAPEMLAEFRKVYRAPKIIDTNVTLHGGPNLLCRKCGLRVGNKSTHETWHKELSLRMYALNYLIRELGRATGFTEEEN